MYLSPDFFKETQQRKEALIIAIIRSIKNEPIFGYDFDDDWSWDREEEELRECHDDGSFVSDS